MRGVFVVLIVFGALAGSRVRGESALDALAHIPKDQLPHLVKMEARGGTPEPDRWYILVYDPSAESGVHEFVVSKGQVVASRALSQFAESLKPGDAMDAAAIKTDSDAAEKVAGAYAAANGVPAAGVDYDLKRAPIGGEPEWTISCNDALDTRMGSVTLSAATATVLSHEGFAHTPEEIAASGASATPDSEPARKTPKFDVYADPVVVAKRTDERGRTRSSPKPVNNPVGNAFKSVGRTLQHIFPF